METKTIFRATKSEILALLKLLARISDCYTSVDKEKKALIIRTALEIDERDLGKVININKEITSLDINEFDAIIDAEEIIMLDE